MAPEEEAARELRSVEPQVWKACAGTAARIAAVGSRIYYFPQGHAEQASSPPDFSAVRFPRAAALCRISAVRLLANPDTDEVFASIALDPRVHPPLAPSPPRGLPPSSSSSPPEVADGDGGFVSFAKILTPSDANNGGGFSVPRFCADSIFPPLDFNADPPVQTISVRDVHGKSWNFRHIYRGTPRRHLLTTGWSKFVNSKKLIAGDAVVFMKNLSGQMFVGIRRASRSCGPVDYSSYDAPAAAAVKIGENFAGSEGFSRNVRGRVPAASVVEAVRLAGMDLPFEVLYYPRAGSPDFVVPEEAVEAAKRVYWTAGMRVRMPVETEDSARMTWFQGAVSSVAMNDVGPWPRSPWRMLQVIWDEPEVLQNFRNVSPWQVELVSSSPQIETSFFIKRLKAPESSEFLDDAEDSMLVQMTGMKSKTIGSLTPSVFNYSVFPAGMQGARHDSIVVPSLCNSMMNTHQTFLNGLHGVNVSQKNDVSIELRIGGTSSQSGGSSPPSPGSIQVLDRKILEPASTPVKKASTGSFQLFGQVIHIEQLTNDDADREYEDTKGEDGSHGSFPYPRKRLVTQCPRVSAVGACQ